MLSRFNCIDFFPGAGSVLVQRIFGTDSAKEADTLLWHCTAFPFASVLHVARQLRDIRKKSGGNFEKAIAIADKEIEEAMRGASPVAPPCA